MKNLDEIVYSPLPQFIENRVRVMGKTMGKSDPLTVLEIKQLRKPGLHADGKTRGLYLQIAATDTKTKSWVYRYQLRGRRRDMGLGSIDVVPLAKARELAHEARLVVTAGGDPIEDRRAKHSESRSTAKVPTFKDCAEGYVLAHQAAWRSIKHRGEWMSSLERFAYPLLGSLPVHTIDTALVLEVLGPIWISKSVTAARVRQRVEAVLDWAKSRGHREGENPARWRGHLQNLLAAHSKLAKVQHFAAMPYADIGEFMVRLRAQEGVAGRALEFAILTAARRGEVLGARWAEFDVNAKVWTIPAERMKAKREHRVPLSDAAMAVIEAMAAIRHTDFVFPGLNGAINDMAMTDVLRRLGYDVQTHGFRSSFRDWAAEQTAFPRELAEQALAHTVGDAVERAYRRGDAIAKRREMMDRWAEFCAEPASAIVPLRA